MNAIKVSWLFVIAVTVSALTFPAAPPVNATTAGFKAGRIIDDSVMTNDSSMSVADIQSFLNSKVPNCDTNGQQLSEYGGPDLNRDGRVQRWEWAKNKYNQTKFTCLKDWKASNGNSAARVIYNKSHDYSINPQVLLVLLQKEQGLITDTWPLNIQYRTATGYGCPDTAPCDSQYYGLQNQLDWAAKMYHSIITRSPSWYSPYLKGANPVVYWHPDTGRCGSSPLTIVNWSTASLYSYTPYRPNQAALNAGYGTGNSCSSYGNRNFYNYFTDWFGSTMEVTPFFSIKNDNKIYLEGADNSYYHVQNPAQLYSFGYRTLFTKVKSVTSGYLSGKTNKGALPYVVRFKDQSSIYTVTNNGTLNNFPSAPMYESNYGYSFGDEAVLDTAWYASYRRGGAITETMRLSDGNEIYSVNNGKKRHISSFTAYTTLGSPTYSTLPTVTLNTAYASTIPTGAPILVDDSVLYARDTKKYYLWTLGQLTQVSKALYDKWGIKATYTSSSTAINQLGVVSGILSDYVNVGDKFYAFAQDRLVELSPDNISSAGIEPSDYPSISSNFSTKLRFTTVNDIHLLRFADSDRVYARKGIRDIFKISNLNDFNKLNYNFKEVFVLPPELRGLYQEQGFIFPPASLVRLLNDNAVYLTTSTQSLHHIPSPDILRQYNFAPKLVRVLADPGDLNGYTEGHDITRIARHNQNNNYYIIDRGKRYPISPSNLSSWYGSTPPVPSLDPDSLSRTVFSGSASRYIRDISNGKVYQINEGKKRWYTSPSRFLMDAEWSDIQDVTSGFVKDIPDGLDIN